MYKSCGDEDVASLLIGRENLGEQNALASDSVTKVVDIYKGNAYYHQT